MTKRADLGFFAGVRALLGGVGFVVGRPSVWPLALVPVLAASFLLAAFTALSIWGGTELAERLVARDHGVVGWAVKIALWVVGIVLGFFVALSLAQPISGFALESIARRQELALGGRAWPDQPFLRGLARSLRVSLAALAVSLPIVAVLGVVSLVLPPLAVVTIPLQLVVTGLVAAYDFLDYPFSLRGAEVSARIEFMKTHFWAVLGFGVTAAALMLVPGAALLLLPFGVAGATRIVVEADR